MSLKITGKHGDQVFWRLYDSDGRCDIVDGEVFSTYFCGGPFDMKPDVLEKVSADVQSWLTEHFPI